MLILPRVLVFIFGSMHCVAPLFVAFETLGLNGEFIMVSFSWLAFGLIYIFWELKWIVFAVSKRAEIYLVVFIAICGAINLMWIFKEPFCDIDYDFMKHLKIFFKITEIVLSFIIVHLAGYMKIKPPRAKK